MTPCEGFACFTKAWVAPSDGAAICCGLRAAVGVPAALAGGVDELEAAAGWASGFFSKTIGGGGLFAVVGLVPSDSALDDALPRPFRLEV